MVYRVPEFLSGLPVYDAAEVASSVAESLADDGFLVDLYGEDTLYVSWDRGEGRPPAEGGPAEGR